MTLNKMQFSFVLKAEDRQEFLTFGLIMREIPHTLNKNKCSDTKPHFGHFCKELFKHYTPNRNVKNKKAVKMCNMFD